MATVIINITFLIICSIFVCLSVHIIDPYYLLAQIKMMHSERSK